MEIILHGVESTATTGAIYRKKIELNRTWRDDDWWLFLRRGAAASPASLINDARFTLVPPLISHAATLQTK